MVISDISECKRNKNRVNVYVEEEFAFACYMETAVKHHLKKGAVIAKEQIDTIIEEDGNSYAFQSALKYVSSKPRTEKEIADMLRSKNLQDGNIWYALGKLSEYGYVDDLQYADIYARELSAKYGGKMIYQKLIARGIDSEAARDASSRYGTDEAIMGHIQKLEAKYAGEDDLKRRQKMIRSLMAKGFGYDEIKRAMGGMDES